MSPLLSLSNGESELAPIPISLTRTDQVLEVLRDAIIHKTLDPGLLYSVQTLATQLGVSRTPVREALLQLARAGMVQFVRNRGVRVLETSLDDLRQIFEIRLMLEVPACFEAVGRAGPELGRRLSREYDAMVRYAKVGDERGLWSRDRAFHVVLLRASGNDRLAHYIDTLRDLVLMRGTTTANRSRSMMEIAVEHRPVLDAVLAGDATRASTEMRRHIQHTADLVRNQLSLE